MELRLPHMLHLFNVFHENDGKENCAQVLEEEVNKMFGTKSLKEETEWQYFIIQLPARYIPTRCRTCKCPIYQAQESGRLPDLHPGAWIHFCLRREIFLCVFLSESITLIIMSSHSWSKQYLQHFNYCSIENTQGSMYSLHLFHPFSFSSSQSSNKPDGSETACCKQYIPFRSPHWGV